MSIESIVDSITPNTISFILLALCSFWLLKVIIKKQGEILLRVSLIFIIVFLGFIFFQRSEIGEWTFPEIKQNLFPEKFPTLNYRVESDSPYGEFRKRYLFEAPRPKLILSLDKRGDYLNLNRISSLNVVLKALDLPPVKHGAKELASITGLRRDIKFYRWEDYPLGVLIVERELCQYRKSLESYHCLVSITLKSKRT